MLINGKNLSNHNPFYGIVDVLATTFAFVGTEVAETLNLSAKKSCNLINSCSLLADCTTGCAYGTMCLSVCLSVCRRPSVVCNACIVAK